MQLTSCIVLLAGISWMTWEMEKKCITRFRTCHKRSLCLHRNMDHMWQPIIHVVISGYLLSITINEPERFHHIPCKDCRFNVKELEQILLFKNYFIQSSTISEHLLILWSQILPTMFNYWALQGKEPRDKEESQTWAKVYELHCNLKWRNWLSYQPLTDSLVLKQLVHGMWCGMQVK